MEDDKVLCGEAFAMAQESSELMDKLVALCKRRGFIFQSSEIYGGIGGFWDYGPLGVELKRNLKDAWWRDVVRRRGDVVGLDCSIIMNPKVWEASGHLDGFSDPMVTCKDCKRHMREDQLSMCLIQRCETIPDEDFADKLDALKPADVQEGVGGFMIANGAPAEEIQAGLRRRLPSKRAKVIFRGDAVLDRKSVV